MNSLRLSLLPRVAVLAATGLAATLLPATKASAVLLTVAGVDYDISTLNTSFTGSSVGILQSQIWYTNSISNNTTASAFSAAWIAKYGGLSGPVWAYISDGTNVSWLSQGISSPFAGISPVGRVEGYATATLIPASSSSVPGPLPVFGAAAAFGFSRKLRQRIKLSPPPALID